ncbi:hypothetical protein F4780DRAFT_150278 [Xylariomycetidae sp. FL0641]|nr:hypothetical protein F4780DRAFT_150278 [Xylariomycetidae sp. FL0641]
MKFTAATLSFIALGHAQVLDFGFVAEVPTVTVPVGVVSSISVYNPVTAAASVSADVILTGVQGTMDPLNKVIADVITVVVETAKPTSVPNVPSRKRHREMQLKQNIKRDDCDALPSGSGPVPSPDTADAFRNDPDFVEAADNATTPAGYDLAFQNLNTSTSAYGYMGAVTLDSYDVEECASTCNATTACDSFNIYFERAPTLEPAPACPNPASSTVIKCVLWSGSLSTENTLNGGQFQQEFEVVKAGSNGYNSKSFEVDIDGYTEFEKYGDAAIQAPLDCNGANTYMGYKFFPNPPFDPQLCQAACEAQSAFNLANPPADGSPPMLCHFFNTFMVYLNGGAAGQYCAMYNETWDASYATNTGLWRGFDHYTIQYSLGYSNTSDPGTCVPTSS